METIPDVDEHRRQRETESALEEIEAAMDHWFYLHDVLSPEEARVAHRRAWPGVWKEADGLASGEIPW